ncbi:MAG: hypothetical protein PF590_07680 [Candidatus Delongbacteria bacterium]|jgi:hypothetical protein|nr:hypothetical protein [Candidatus Delongbacteria bacterium]
MMNDNKHTYQQLKSYFENEIFDKEELVTMIHENKLYDVCFDLAMTNDNPAAWRSAWVLSACRKKYPEQCKKYLPDVIRALPLITRDGQIRELLKIFRNLAYEELPEQETGLLFDFCMHTFQDAAKQPGTRSTALQVLLIFARKEPDLLGEIQAAFHFIKPQLSKGIRQSCEHKINRLQNEYEC